MLKARATAGGAAAVAAVEAELRRGVAALLRHGQHRKQLTHGVPRADVTRRVGACSFANGRLVDKHHIAQVVGAQQAVVCAWGFGGAAKVAHQGRGQHVLYQGRFARATDARYTDQALQRELNGQVLQVVFARTLQNQTWRVVSHQTLEPQANGFARAQVGTGQGVGGLQGLGRAIEHNAAAAHTGAGTHVQNAVRAQHHRRVVLHHHQGVAGIAQAQHGQVDAVHVARVQANAGLIQDKQGVDQGGAQGRGQVDALYLTATQGAALSVQREVANADIAEVLQPGANFLHQQMQGLRVSACGIHLHGMEELVQLVDRHQHQVVQAQARHGFELLACPGHALGHEAFVRFHHRIGVVFAANAPQQAVGLQTRAATHTARGVAAVFGEQHTDVHLVRLAL